MHTNASVNINTTVSVNTHVYVTSHEGSEETAPAFRDAALSIVFFVCQEKKKTSHMVTAALRFANERFMTGRVSCCTTACRSSVRVPQGMQRSLSLRSL